MKIAFWSNSQEKCDVMHNMATIGIACASLLPYKILMMENYLSNHNLGKVLCNDIMEIIREDSYQYNEYCLFEKFVQNVNGLEYGYKVHPYIHEVIENKLYYLPQQGRFINKNVFDYELNNNISYIARIMNELVDLKFICTKSTDSLSSKYILEEASLIIVNLSQDIIDMVDFFDNYYSLVNKSVFIINIRDINKCRENYRLLKKYGIEESRTVFIPYNEMILYYTYCGLLTKFILFNMEVSENEKDMLYFEAIKKVALIIHRYIQKINNNNMIDIL